jgi:hypothetical protein
MGRRQKHEVVAYMKVGTACFRTHKSEFTIPHILSHIDPFLGNDLEISKYTTAVTK